MKHKPQKSDIRTRELPPKVERTKRGVQVQCPFCVPTHPILPGVQSPCGTRLQITAVQPILTSHAVKHARIACLKCGQGGGDMIRYRNGYVHLNECAPDTKLITEIPPLSKFAGFVYRLPPALRERIEKRLGPVKQLEEIDAEGKQTGKIVGYFFWKGK